MTVAGAQIYHQRMHLVATHLGECRKPSTFPEAAAIKGAYSHELGYGTPSDQLQVVLV